MAFMRATTAPIAQVSDLYSATEVAAIEAAAAAARKEASFGPRPLYR